MFAPQSGHSLGVDQFEDALLSLHPLDISGAGVLILQQLQQELPEIGGVSYRTQH